MESCKGPPNLYFITNLCPKFLDLSNSVCSVYFFTDTLTALLAPFLAGEPLTSAVSWVEQGETINTEKLSDSVEHSHS